MPSRAVVFDFNGTLSDDEPILCEIFQQLFAEHGRPLSAQKYYDELAGLSDPEIVRSWLGPDHPAVEEVVRERIARYGARVGAAGAGRRSRRAPRRRARTAAARVSRPLVIAHQGASWDAPANTIAAFELAIEQGAEYVEFDVRAGPDGTLVVAHDPVRAPRPAHVPTLDATLEVLGCRSSSISDHARTRSRRRASGASASRTGPPARACSPALARTASRRPSTRSTTRRGCSSSPDLASRRSSPTA